MTARPAASARRAAWLALSTALALGSATEPAAAQNRPPDRPTFGRPLLTSPTRSRVQALSQRPIAPLSPAHLQRLAHARGLREGGQPDAARLALTALLEEVPHHPMVLAELAAVYVDRQAWKGLESMARAERAATRDSVLLAAELVKALELSGQSREAAQVTLEAWIAEPAMADWANGTLVRLGNLEAKTRETLRRAVERRPDRPDLALGVARLTWKSGDTIAAMKMLASGDRSGTTPLRWVFAEELLSAGTRADTSGATDALLDLAGDGGRDIAYRLAAGRRGWALFAKRGAEVDGAARVAKALKDIPAERWGNEFAIPVARALRQAGRTGEARTLMSGLGEESSGPDVALERALNELRDAPSDKALALIEKSAAGSPEGAYRYAEALFFAGRTDSALVWYQRVAEDPRGAWTGAALERIYLIEDAQPQTALALLGRLAYEEWRGETKRALPLADSLYRTLPHTPLWAHAAITLARLKESSGDGKSALEPLLAVAEQKPDDRLAPLARQRAGDVYRVWLKDDAKALEQYEECLARYPRSWNAAEVRRMVEALRRDRRF